MIGRRLPGILAWLPSPTVLTHDALEEALQTLEPGARIADLGAGGRRIRPDVVAVDFMQGPGVDVVADVHDLPLEDASFDCVVCTGTLEHVRDPRQVVSEIHRILKPGGLVYIDVPFIQGYHPDPTDYWRFTLEGLRLMCEAFEEQKAGVHIGPTCGVVWIMREWANGLTGNRILSNLLLFPVAILTAPLRYLDYLVVRSPRAHHVASAVYFAGRRQSESAALTDTSSDGSGP